MSDKLYEAIDRLRVAADRDHTDMYFRTAEPVKSADLNLVLDALAAWRRAVVDLTPSGSVFVDDPEYCVAYIRKHTEPRMIIDLRERVKILLAAGDAMFNAFHSNHWSPGRNTFVNIEKCSGCIALAGWEKVKP